MLVFVWVSSVVRSMPVEPVNGGSCDVMAVLV